MDDDEYDYSNLNGDWSQTFDDMDGADWAYHMGGPDDDEIDRYYENIAETYEEEYSDYEDYVERQQVVDEGVKDDESILRMEEIVEWLCESKLAMKFINKEGFFVSKGPHVRLKDDSVVDLLDWLFEEGVKGGVVIAGYSIVYSGSQSSHGEKLSFFRIIVDAPFFPLSRENNKYEADGDIPF